MCHFLCFKTETVPKSKKNPRNIGKGDSYCSISVKCQESGYEILTCYKEHAKIDTFFKKVSLSIVNVL